MTPTRTADDFAAPYFNSIVRLFHDPAGVDARRRIVEPNGIADYLLARWLVSEDEIRGEPEKLPPEPLWRYASSASEPMDLVDLLAFLVADIIPQSLSWRIPHAINNVKRLNSFEKGALCGAIFSAATHWTLDMGRFNRGLDEILRFIEKILTADFDAASGRPIFHPPELALGCLAHIVTELEEFHPDCEDWSTVADIGRSFDLLARFFIRLNPHDSFRYDRQRLKQYSSLLANRAHHLMTGFGTGRYSNENRNQRGWLDLIDGDLLPWAIFAEFSEKERQPAQAFQLAWERYDLVHEKRKGATNLKGVLAINKIGRVDLRMIPEGAFYATVTVAIGSGRCEGWMGAYNFVRVLILAEKLCLALDPAKIGALPDLEDRSSAALTSAGEKLELTDIPKYEGV
jgi:hypothetical protein